MKKLTSLLLLGNTFLCLPVAFGADDITDTPINSSSTALPLSKMEELVEEINEELKQKAKSKEIPQLNPGEVT